MVDSYLFGGRHRRPLASGFVRFWAKIFSIPLEVHLLLSVHDGRGDLGASDQRYSASKSRKYDNRRSLVSLFIRTTLLKLYELTILRFLSVVNTFLNASVSVIPSTTIRNVCSHPIGRTSSWLITKARSTSWACSNCGPSLKSVRRWPSENSSSPVPSD